MRHSTLGPTVQTFGPSLRITAILFVAGLLPCGLAYAVAHEIQDRTAWIVFDSLTLGFGVYFASHLSCRAWLHEAGISYRNLLGYGEVRWEEIEQIYFGAVEVHAHWMPLGTFERLKIITNLQKRVSFGGNIQNTGGINAAAVQRTFERLYGKVVEEFNSGSELKFGAIRVSRSQGVIIRGWFFSRTIPWPEIAGFRADDYFVSFERMAKHFTIRVAAERVANVRVLHSLLMGVMKHVW
jgi:hypothetical protein